MYQYNQSFTTGNNAATVGSIDLSIQYVDPLNTTFSVAIYSDNNGSLGTSLSGGLLANPATYEQLATNTFTASGLTLSANTTYWLVLANPGSWPQTGAISESMTLPFTSTPAASSSDGWTLGNQVWVYGDGSTWNNGTGNHSKWRVLLQYGFQYGAGSGARNPAVEKWFLQKTQIRIAGIQKTHEQGDN